MAVSEELDIEKQPADEVSSAAPEPAPNGDGEASDDGEEQLRAELDQARKDCDDMLGQLQRAQAEFENVRKRMQREKEDVVRYAASETIQSLLPIVDDFERAIETEGLPPEVKTGLELIHRRIFEVFTRAGLKEVAQHESFDPTLHFAVDRAPATDEQADQQILAVYQKGYFFKDRLVRASMVKVAVKD